MGMFDYVRSSYPLPEPFMGENQTKGIEEGYDGTMSHFWIDPAGYLWVGNYAGCHTLEIYEEGDPRYQSGALWANYDWAPTGIHGKWRVQPITKYIEIYPAVWDGKWEDWPRCRLHFKNGKLQDYEVVTGR